MLGTYNMKKLNVQEKSKGVVLFAFNSTINYIKIAEKCAKLVDYHLKLPVTLITDTPNNITYKFDNVILTENTIDNYKSSFDLTVWRNANRYQAYELSPYTETLLLDTDYLILDQSLLKLSDNLVDYQIMQYNQTPTESWNFDMGNNSVPYQWATVIWFNKTIKSKQLFDLVGRIQRNYYYYKRLYHIRESNFRNDYAFSIANLILNGYSTNKIEYIPWTMLTLDKKIESLEYKNNFIVVREKEKAYMLPKQNMHIMDKEYLLGENFTQFIDTLCQ